MKPKLAMIKAPPRASGRGGPKGLFAEVRLMILTARQSVAQTVNARLTLLHWQIGQRIRKDILREKRAGYGERIVSSLATQLEAEFGRGFGQRNLFHMVRFAEVFPDIKIVQSLIGQLGWTHFLHIIRLDDPLKRDFQAGKVSGPSTAAFTFDSAGEMKKPSERARKLRRQYCKSNFIYLIAIYNSNAYNPKTF